MLNVMTTAQNAIEAYNDALRISSSNIANMNVPGYKKLDISFQSIFERTLASGGAAEKNSGGSNPYQLGEGMSISGTTVDFSEGALTEGSPMDLAISGNGLFIISPDEGNTFLYTRAGNFQIDRFGNLTSNNMQVYGFNSAGIIAPVSGLPSGNKANYRWKSNGKLEYSPDGGTTYVETQYSIALTYFANPGGLEQAQGTAFRETLASGLAATSQLPGGAAGSINPGQIEQSNVSYLTETINALELQRAMSGNLSMLKMASDTISSFIQKLG